jgi:O-antigen ligase
MVFALKSMLVILLLAFVAAELVIRAKIFGEEDIPRFRALTHVVMATVFLAFTSQSFWVYTLLAGGLFIWAVKRVQPVPLLVALFFALPVYQRIVPLPGGGTMLSVGLHHVIIWVGAWVVASRQDKRRGTESNEFLISDLLIFAWLTYQWTFLFRETTLTHTIKTAVNDLTFSFLIYYVFSRGLSRLSDLKAVMQTFAFVAVLLGAIAAFESVRHWLLYPPIETALSIPAGPLQYLARAGFLRAQGSAGHPIVLGILLGVGLLFWAAILTDRGKKPNFWQLFCIALVSFGLIVSFSRGAWVSTVIAYLAFVFLSRNMISRFLQFAVALALALVVLKTIPGGEKVIAMLPFVGESETGSVDYRARLFEISMYVFWEHPWLGSPTYLQEPVMQSLIQGQGIIDMVNSYLAIALSGGFVGLTLFAACFLAPMLQLLKALRARPLVLPQMVFACTVLYLVAIATVSTINSLVLLSWMLIGLCAGAARLTRDGARLDV